MYMYWKEIFVYSKAYRKRNFPELFRVESNARMTVVAADVV